MSRHGTYDLKYGFIPDDDCPRTYLCDSCALYPCGESGVKLERRCPAYNPIPKPQTNADRIRSMTDEELAELWWERVDCGECPVHRNCKMTGQDCKKLALEWLREECHDGLQESDTKADREG